MNQTEVNKIIEILSECYPHVKCPLEFENTFELMVSTILAAQCTDARVNQVTDVLYKEYNTPEAFLTLSQEELEKKIHECGFFRNKAKNILAASKMLIEEFNGVVPGTMEELIQLPGVGRKTANVILANGFGIPAMPVDTHVLRVANRIGLAHSSKDPDKTEMELTALVPKDKWILVHHLIINHGRTICDARKPKCNECKIREFCDYGRQNPA